MRWASRGGAAAALCLSVAGGCGPSPAAGPPPPRPPAASTPPPPRTPAHEATPHRAVGTWEPDDVDTSAPPALARLVIDERLYEGDGPAPTPSIEAVRRVRGLRHLAVRSHALRDVSALAGLEQLEVLVLDGSPRVSRVPPLTSLPALSRLGLHGTALSDVEPFAGADQLRALDLGGTRVEDLTPLGTLARLVELNLAGTFATDLSPLAKLQGLWALDVSHVPARDFSALRDLRCLRRLVVDFVAGFGLEALPRAGALEALSARGTGLDDVSALGRHDGLVELWLGDNPALDDVAPLAGLARLRFVDLSATSVTHLDPLIVLPHLEHVVLTRTPVDSAARARFRRARPDVQLDDFGIDDAAAFRSTEDARRTREAIAAAEQACRRVPAAQPTRLWAQVGGTVTLLPLRTADPRASCLRRQLEAASLRPGTGGGISIPPWPP